MLRRFGLATRLLLVALLVLSPAVTLSFYIVEDIYVDVIDRESEATARASTDTIVRLVKAYGLPGDFGALRAEIAEPLVNSRGIRLDRMREEHEVSSRIWATRIGNNLARRGWVGSADFAMAEAFASAVEVRDQEMQRISDEEIRSDRILLNDILDRLVQFGLPGEVERLRDEVIIDIVNDAAKRSEPRLTALSLLSPIERGGRILTVAHSSYYGRQPIPTSTDARALESATVQVESVVREGVPHIAVSSPFEHRGESYVLHAEYGSSRRLSAESRSTSALVRVLAFSALALIVFLTLLVRMTVIRPIGLLERAMADARRIGLGRTLPVYNDDQFGNLIRTFNEMSLDLKGAAERNKGLMRELQNFNRELEVRVDEATRDLKAKNSELIVTQERLHGVQQDVSKLERMASLGQLSSMLAHELSTPLNVVLGHLEILEREVAESKGPHARVVTLLSQVNRLVGILREMLTAVRMPDPQPVDVSLVELALEAQRFLNPTLMARGIEMIVECPDTPATAFVDQNQAQQVILNVVTNAVDVTPDGGLIKMSIEDAADTVTVRIHDSGPGVPEDELNRIFEPFFTTKGPDHGVGLGLAISLDIMRKNGGAMSAANHPDGGAVFSMTFSKRREAAGSL